MLFMVTWASGGGVSPIVVTANWHGLHTGDHVIIAGDFSNLALNSYDAPVTVIDANNFSLDGTTGTGDWNTVNHGPPWGQFDHGNGQPMSDGPWDRVGQMNGFFYPGGNAHDDQVCLYVPGHGMSSNVTNFVIVRGNTTPMNAQDVTVNGTWAVEVVDANNFVLLNCGPFFDPIDQHGWWARTIVSA